MCAFYEARFDSAHKRGAASQIASQRLIFYLQRGAPPGRERVKSFSAAWSATAGGRAARSSSRTHRRLMIVEESGSGSKGYDNYDKRIVVWPVCQSTPAALDHNLATSFLAAAAIAMHCDRLLALCHAPRSLRTEISTFSRHRRCTLMPKSRLRTVESCPSANVWNTRRCRSSRR